jgi:hypothetical protein
MWEKDRQLIVAFRECFANVNQQIQDGEEVDLKTVCEDETQVLLRYTLASINYYKEKHPQQVKDRHQ